jgi:hypothetical protein
MPADIRSFFGGGPKASQGSQASQPVAKKAAPKKTGRASRIVDDSDDDEEEEVKYAPSSLLRNVSNSCMQAQESYAKACAEETEARAHPRT